jgi:CheY-like chemotaxis protein
MSQATQDRIFDPFFTTKGPGEGTGLGLATVYGIVAQSGGRILVYSEPDQGTCFKIYFPRICETPHSAAMSGIGDLPNGTETILVVEDEDSVRDLASRILRKRGYSVIEAANGPEGLARAEEHGGAIDLLLTDVVMPKVMGTELAVRLKEIQPGTKVLFMSGYSDSAVIGRGALLPNSPFLEKPFTLPALILKVREVLDNGQ